jgi:tRNA A-37 threonylcarbamoyl transferase component Bud32
LALDDALNRLAAQDRLKAKPIKLRYYVRLPLDQVAEVLGVSRVTAVRNRAWLHRTISKDLPSNPHAGYASWGRLGLLIRDGPMSEEDLFEEARRRTPAERAAFLEANCADPDMLRRVDARLKAFDAAGAAVEPLAATETYARPPGATEDQLEGTTVSFVPPAGSAVIEQVGERIGPYKLLQKLGEGGMGTVWVAEQSEPVKRRVALKLIKAGMDSMHVLRRFEAERQALALMDHQNIAKVLDAGATPQGRPYFAMELIKGIAITKYCDQEHLTPRERFELFVCICQAVQHAHQKGVIHRDLKPSNVLIALYDGKPVPKVIDFGVAKATSQKLTERTMYTEVGQIVGTLEYMAPEQAELNNLDIDTRADIYSLGVILYELLTGSPGSPRCCGCSPKSSRPGRALDSRPRTICRRLQRIASWSRNGSRA